MILVFEVRQFVVHNIVVHIIMVSRHKSVCVYLYKSHNDNVLLEVFMMRTYPGSGVSSDPFISLFIIFSVQYSPKGSFSYIFG